MGGIALVAGLAGGACWLLVVHGCGLKLPMCNNIYLLNCIAFTMINLSYIIHLKVMVFVSLKSGPSPTRVSFPLPSASWTMASSSVATVSTDAPTTTTSSQDASGFNQTKRHWARAFLWITSVLLIFDMPLLSLITSSSAVYTMHGGKWLSHKNFKWMGASIVSFCVSLYALALRVESDFVDEERAYELKTTLNVKHRIAEIIWGGLLFLCLIITVKEHVDKAIEATTTAVDDLSKTLTNGNNQKKQD
jgi:hypothetical protein